MKGTFSPSAKHCYMSSSEKKPSKQEISWFVVFFFLLKESIPEVHFVTLL